MDFAGQAIFHTLVAALVIEALIRLWGVRQPEQRTGFRLLALGWPLLVVPALFVAFPVREAEAFRDARAIFAGRHWDDLAFLGIGLYGWWIAFMGAAGLGLFLLDLVPWMRARGAQSPPWVARAPEARSAEEALARAAHALRMEAPPLAWVGSGPPILFCTGTRQPTVVISRAAVDLLDGDELTGALAHELAHLRYRDPALGWALMGLRTLFFFNPAVQVLARLAAREMESRADDSAVALVKDPSVLAATLVKTFRWGLGHRRLGRLLEPLRVRALERRCRRLLDTAPRPDLGAPALHLGVTAAGLAALLLFVV